MKPQKRKNMYCILRLKKIKTRAQLSACQNHNLRLKPVPNADPNKTHLNKTAGAADYKTLIAELEDKFNKHNIKPRKDSVQAVEVVLTASPEFFTGEEEQLRKWVNQNYKWAKKEFGSNLLQFTLHQDELTPHIHLIFTPITTDGRLSMKDLYGGKDKLQSLQSRYAESMGEFGLKRGKEGSLAKNTTIKEFYNFTNKLKNLKPNQIKKLAKDLEEFEKENEIEDEKEKDKQVTTDYETMLKKITNTNFTEQIAAKRKLKRKRG